MTLSPADWRKLQPSLLLCLALVLAGGGLLSGALGWQQQAHSRQAAAQARRDQALARLKQASEEEQETRQKAGLFGDLAARGMVGEEQRLEWVELLRDIRSQRRLPDLQYEFAPQQAMAGNQGSWNFYVSPMHLELQLLHEEDLLNFLADLRHRAKAQVLTRDCDLGRRPPSQAPEGGPRANLEARCTLEWITLRGPRPAGSGEKAP